MPTWTEVDFSYEPFGMGSETFVLSRDGFPADGLRKSSAAPDSSRQRHFVRMLERLSERLGSRTLPVFVSFDGERRRMDRGCVGHAVAAGLLEKPVNGGAGFVEQVTLRGRMTDRAA